MRRWTGQTKAAGGLQQSLELQCAATQLGFDWPDTAPVWDKLSEELGELREAAGEQDPAAIQHEFGDVIFSLMNLARFLDVDVDAAIAGSNQRFDQRLRGVQQALDDKGQAWSECDLAQLEAYWQAAKQRLRAAGR